MIELLKDILSRVEWMWRNSTDIPVVESCRDLARDIKREIRMLEKLNERSEEE